MYAAQNADVKTMPRKRPVAKATLVLVILILQTGIGRQCPVVDGACALHFGS